MSLPSLNDATSAVNSSRCRSARMGKRKRGSTGPTGTEGACRQAPARAVDGIDGTPRGVGGAKVVTVAVDVGSPSRLPVPRNRLGGGGTGRRGGRLRALTSAAVWPEGWRGGMDGGAAGGQEELGRRAGGGARCAAARHWPLHPWEASACWTRNPAGAVSAESGTPPRSPCKILTAEPNSESIASTSPHPPRHCLSTCSRTGLGRNSGPASSRADRSIRSCEAVSPPDRPANTRRASLTTDMASDAGRDPSQPDGAPSGRTRVHSTLGPRAPSRPRPLIARGGWRPPTEWDAVSATAPCRDPPPSTCPCSRDGPNFRAGGCSPPPRPLALPWPRPRPRPPRPALPRLIPSGIVGAGGGAVSARWASATAPRSAASAASTARAASSAARAASAVMASARRRARATWRRWLREISPGMGLSGSEASRPSMARTHRWGDESQSTTQSEWWPRPTVSGWPEKAGTAGSSTTANRPSWAITCGPARTHPWDDERENTVRTAHPAWRPL